MIKKILMGMSLVVLMSACVSTNAIMLADGSTYPVVSPENIRVFISENDVPGEFIKIALVTVKGWQSDQEAVLYMLKKKAGSLGADAIVLKSAEGEGLFSYSYGRGEALAIRLKKS